MSLPPNSPDNGPQKVGPEAVAPDLELLQGGGQGGEPEGGPRPELYVVPDAAPDAEAASDQATPAPSVRPESAAEPAPGRPSARHLKAAGQAVRAVSLRGAEGLGIGKEEQQYRGGGGGWLIREHMKKLAEERAKAEAASHEPGCYCSACNS